MNYLNSGKRHGTEIIPESENEDVDETTERAAANEPQTQMKKIQAKVFPDLK